MLKRLSDASILAMTVDVTKGLAISAMQRLSSILVKFDESATATNLS